MPAQGHDKNPQLRSAWITRRQEVNIFRLRSGISLKNSLDSELEIDYTKLLRDTATCCRNRKDNMKNLIKISALALVFLAGVSRYAQADPPSLNGGSYHRMTPTPQTPHINDADPKGPHPRNPTVAPEIDPSLAWSALAMLAGSLVILGNRRKKAVTL
jgi:hypothetical protein